MSMELPDGKTARNLQEQVKFLTEKLRDLYAVVNQIGISIVVVETLPEEGEPYKIYLLPAEDPETGNYYEEYIWYDDAWEMIGSTKIDLSDYCTLSTEQTLTGHKIFSHITTQNLDSGEGDLVFTSSGVNIKPYADDSVSLGTSDNKWKDFYLSGKILLGNGLYIAKDASNRIGLYYNNIEQIKIGSTGSSYCAINWVPDNNNAFDLGRSGLAWKDFYIGGKITHTSYSIEWDNGILFKNSSNTTLFYIGSDRSCWIYGTIIPQNGNNLGNSTHVLGTTYTTNLNDGTNSASVADIAALITYAKAQGWIS